MHDPLLSQDPQDPQESCTVPECPTTVTPSGAVVVRPEGRLDFGAATDLRNQLKALVEGGNTRLVVNLAAVPSTDSAGLGALIEGLKATRQYGGDLRLAAVNVHIKAALELTNLDQFLRSFDTADQAFAEPSDAGSAAEVHHA
jgi:anti-anti-sigma factor